jgi:3-carboxy-cis,cis-muconate cycloisomerase
MTLTSGRLTDHLCANPEALAIWGAPATLQRMLDVEAALASALADAQVIPATAVEPIRKMCDVQFLDVEALVVAAASGGNLAIPLVKQLTAAVKSIDPEAARFVHWGATSQDIIDSGMMLQAKDTLDLMLRQIDALISTLATQAQTHRATPMVGRTWLQQALPITLGLKFAQQLDAMVRHRERLLAARERAICLQFGGAAGTLASLGDNAPAVVARLSALLALPEAAIPWHTQRDRIAELACCWGMISGSLGKIARDIALQMQTEVAELAEPAGAGKGGSSTMPHKRNPVGCAAVLTAAIRVPPLVSTVLAGMVQEHERALGGWQAEWEALPDIARLVCGALSVIEETIAGLEVNTKRLAANLDVTQGLILGEAVMLALGDVLGRLEAHHLVEAASKCAVAEGRSLLSVLREDPQVSAHLSESELTALLDPANYVGQSSHFIDAVLNKASTMFTKHSAI